MSINPTRVGNHKSVNQLNKTRKLGNSNCLMLFFLFCMKDAKNKFNSNQIRFQDVEAQK